MTLSDPTHNEDIGNTDMAMGESEENGLQTLRGLRDALASGALSVRQLVEGTLQNIKVADEQIHAFSYLDEEGALKRADELDKYRISGRPLGPLHGIPIAIKDIIDVKDMPCERGSQIYKGRIPDEDAYIVSLLREAGAVIIGKAVTTEMAYFYPGPTRNPHNTDHTPGGSSSGSAASVASGLVSVSIGSQTNGSMIRPASFCGVFGYKPTFARISRHGVLPISGSLDTMGVFARSLEDMALLGDVIIAYDPRDVDMTPRAKPKLHALMQENQEGEKRYAFMRSPYWDKADESTKDAFRELIEEMKGTIDIVDMPPIFEKVHDAHATLMSYEFAQQLEEHYQNHKDKMSPQLIDIIERGQKVKPEELKDVFELQEACLELLDTYFEDYDAILTPSACGEAPKELDQTGDPGFSTIWQFVGMPCLNLPIFEGPNGLPLGAQLVGQHDRDGRLFSVARQFMAQLEDL